MMRCVDTFAYYNRFNGLRSSFGGLPSWARSLVMIAAFPGILLALLSLLVLLVSIIALLLLTVPVYRIMRFICIAGPVERQNDEVTMDMSPSPGRRQVDAKVIE
jgi:hypothetical protein